MQKNMLRGWVVVVGCLAALTIVAAQGFGGAGGAGGGGLGGGNFTPPSPEDMAKRRLEFMERMLTDQKLSEAEKAPAMEAYKAKSEARTKLQEKLNTVREAGDDQKATDADIAKALNEFIKAQMDYNSAVSSADLALVKKVSVRTRAKLTVLGVVENGVGAGGGGGMFFGGGAGGRTRGGPGGGGPGGAEAGAGGRGTRGGGN